MKVLSHRGYWKEPEERNLPVAFDRSFGLGFGTETDIRDLAGRLVIAHDPPMDGALTAEEMFASHRRHDAGLTLALNVKADGLQAMLAPLIERFAPADAFVFDMSVPDAIQWMKTGIACFTRHSDVEAVPSFYDDAAGVWLDAFRTDDWWDDDVIGGHLAAGKRVCVVSPELHKRDHRPVWDRLAKSAHVATDAVMLCTDLPEDARRFFGHDD